VRPFRIRFRVSPSSPRRAGGRRKPRGSTSTTRGTGWTKRRKEGKLEGPQALFFAPTKPEEELYDTQADPHEVSNLAQSSQPAHVAKLKELRAALDTWIKDTGDLGAVPEEELIRRGIVEDVLSGYRSRKQRADDQ
jgi:hypothetical protein